MSRRSGLRRRRIEANGQPARRQRLDVALSQALDARVERVVEDEGSLSLTCPICRRGELLEQVASMNPRWERDHVERFVDDLLAARAKRAS